jgi:hypothetical protein
MLIAGSSTPSTAFDLVLLLHVGASIVSAVVMVALWSAARSIAATKPGAPWPEVAARFFRPGPEIAGRALYLVPLTGATLVGLSRGACHFGDTFIWMGLVLWAIAAGAAEHLVFSSAAQLAQVVHAGPVPADSSWKKLVVRARLGVDLVAGTLVLATILMVAQP